MIPTTSWAKEGREKGLVEGQKNGREEGFLLGLNDGEKVGWEEGRKKGIEQGQQRGSDEGAKRGAELGFKEGVELGLRNGLENAAQKALMQGRHDCALKIAQKLLKKRFGALEQPVMDRLVKLDAVSMEDLCGAFWDFGNKQELLSWLTARKV